MHVRRGFLNWGVFLICLGAVPLAVQLNVVDRETAASLARLWPLILVGIGLGLMLRFSRFAAIGGLVVAGTLGVLFGVVFAGGLPTGVVCPDQPVGGTAITRNGSFGTSARLDLEVSCADVSVNRSGDSTAHDWNVSVNAGGRTPEITGADASLRLRSADTTGFAPFSDRVRENWLATLPGGVAMSVSGTFNAAKSTLVLGNGALDSVNLTYNASDNRLNFNGATANGSIAFNATYNASSGKLQLPDAPLNGNMTLNASSLNVCLPATPVVRFTIHNTLSSQNLAAFGLEQHGDTWQTPGYASAQTPRIDFNISANVSSLTLSGNGECQ
jgi:hypothetical protein